MAETEIGQLQEREKILEKELEDLLKNGEEAEENETGSTSVIIEIRAGTGGEEAALFTPISSKCIQNMAKDKVGKKPF